LSNEIELKYKPTADEFAKIRAVVQETGTIGNFTVKFDSKECHIDTYFDRDNQMHRARASLRIRRTSDKSARITLKLPTCQPGNQAEIIRREIQNCGEDDAGATLSEIVGWLVRLKIIESPKMSIDLIGRGLFGTLVSRKLVDF